MPFILAEENYKIAIILNEKWENQEINEKNIELYFNDKREMVALLKQAKNYNFGYEEWIKKYYHNVYDYWNNVYNLEYNYFNKKISNQDYEKKLEDDNKNYNSFYIKLFWMDFYMLNPKKN